MNILIGSNIHWWNAEAAYAATISELLVRAGHSVFVLTRKGSLNEKYLRQLELRLVTDININSKNPIRLLNDYHKLKKFLLEEKIDLINAHLSEGFPLFIFAAHALSTNGLGNYIPVIRTRGTTRPLLQHWLNRKMQLDWTDKIITAGEIVSERILEAVPIKPEKLKTIYYPIDCPNIPLRPPEDYLIEFDIPPKAKVIAVVGRIRQVKGQRILLQSLNQLITEFPDMVLLIPYRDTSSNEPEMQALKNDISRFKLEANVRLISERKDILQLMEFADVGVVSSVESEVICRVAVEFFSVATPVVAFPTGCLPEIIRHEKNGMLTNLKTSEALTEELRKILVNPEFCERLGRGARFDAETRFSPQIMLTETLKVFGHALKKK